MHILDYSELARFGVLAAVLSLACVPATPAAPTAPGSATARPGALAPAAAESAPTLGVDMEWRAIERLVSDQKFEEASKEVASIRERAIAAGAQADWTRALAKEVQLRTALHGYETAVRFLREQPWPEGPLYRTALDLIYARQLRTYYVAYQWEIGQREQVDTKGAVDLKAWTRDQIFAEAQRAYEDAWSRREALGNLPASALSDYVETNTYPPGIRGTVRDTLSYLRVELLADTSGWRPDQLNQVWQLDLATLLRGEKSGAAAVRLDDPEVHPLIRMVAVLDDLERWHAGRNEPEAALEAALERLTRLHASFTEPADRATIAAALRQRLDGLERLPWWSMGMATLADFTRQENAPDALVRARAIALEGQQRHPSSMGGERCRTIVAEIEAPSYSLAAMAADSTNRRSIMVTHRNVRRVWMRAWAYDLTERIATSKDYNLLPRGREIMDQFLTRRPDFAWEVELAPTSDFRDHRTFAVPAIDRPGAYIVAASAREDFAEQDNHVEGVGFIATDLVVVNRRLPGALEATVVSGPTGQPIAGARVTLHRFDWNKGHRPLQTLVTGPDGTVSFGANKGGGNLFLVARHGDQVALDSDYLFIPEEPRIREERSSLVYTDRAVYRPTQKALWKVVAYSGRQAQGQFATAAGATLKVSLIDANHQVVESKQVKTNAFGSAAGEFLLPTGRMLGAWRIETSWGGSANVRVEEYKRPTFEVTVQPPESGLRLNRPATLHGEARYYFGLPVTAGQARWRVKRVPVLPWWWGRWGRPPQQEQVIATGAQALTSEGRFELTFTPAADERLGQDRGAISYRYALEVDVTDEGGETRSAQRSFRLGFSSVEATLTADTGFVTSGIDSKLTAVRTNLDGEGRRGKASWRLVAIEQPARTLTPADQPLPPAPEAQAKFQTPGDKLRPRFSPDYSPEETMRHWPDGEQKASGELEHGEDGRAILTLPALAPGAYRVRYETLDEFGAKFETFRDLIVAGRDAPIRLPALLVAERSSVPVGGTARFLVHSGLSDQPLVFEIFQDGRRIARHRLVSGRDGAIVEHRVTEANRGGMVGVLSAVRDHQLMNLSSSVLVPWDDRKLEVELSTFRDRLRPGANETWRVTVRGPAGAKLNAGAAEVLAYMYDRSLDLFAPHTPPDPLSLYPTFLGSAPIGSSIGQASHAFGWGEGFGAIPGWTPPQPDRLAFYDAYGIGGPGRRGGRYPPMRAMRAQSPMKMKQEVMADTAAEAMPAPPAAALNVSDTALGGEPGGAPPAPVTPRENFAETAFWRPQLLLDRDGSVAFEFQVPDSVTAWKVWVHALTRDLKAGSTSAEARSVKELMVRPYLPRFLRERDKAAIEVVINNASDRELKGELSFELLDPETEASVAGEFGLTAADLAPKAFTAPKGGSARLSYPLAAPARVGAVAVKATARSGDFSDGELRPLPLLPSRMHLAQSRFVTLDGASKRTMHFADLARGDDPTLENESMVVTLDAQLFYGVLGALPYLVNYPYECTEQTLNRFVSTGIVSSVYRQYPAVARMAEGLSKRQTPLETFDAADPNRKLALEEMPWLEAARGGKDAGHGVVNVLDQRAAAAERDASLAKLRKAQTASGGFPWFPGGPPSPYLTVYIMYGFAKAAEFGVEIPRDLVQRGWDYLGQHYRDNWKAWRSKDCCWEFLTFLNYAASSYPDPSWTEGALSAKERQEILDFTFGHWRQHSPYLKGYLALTLKRSGRAADAKLVFDSVMDSAKTTEDGGTFWAAEDRSWLWYNDTIETHAFALRTLSELDPSDARRKGLVQWLFLNKKLNHWKSTRATAEVIYSLVHYLKAENQLGVREAATVTIGPKQTKFVFDPSQYTGGRNQVVVPGDQLDPKSMSTVEVEKTTPGFMFASATWHFSTDRLPTEARGDLFSVERSYFRRESGGTQVRLEPLAEGAKLRPGDELEVHLSLRARHAAEYVHLRDPRGAGFEPVSTASRFRWDSGLGYYEEIRDSATNFFFEVLPPGEYTFKYRVRAATAGSFRVGPATLQSMYAPEFTAYSSGATLSIEP